MCPLILFSVVSANFLVTDFRLPRLEIPKGLLKACHHVDCFPVIKHWKELKAKVSSHSVYRYGCYIRPCHVNRDSLCNLWCGFFLPMRGIHCHSLTECLPSLESSLAPRLALGVSLTLQADSCALSTAGWVICAQCRVAWELCFGFCMGLKGARKLKAAQCSADLPFWNSKGLKALKLHCLTPGTKSRFPCWRLWLAKKALRALAAQKEIRAHRKLNSQLLRQRLSPSLEKQSSVLCHVITKI